MPKYQKADFQKENDMNGMDMMLAFLKPTKTQFTFFKVLAV